MSYAEAAFVRQSVRPPVFPELVSRTKTFWICHGILNMNSLRNFCRAGVTLKKIGSATAVSNSVGAVKRISFTLFALPIDSDVNGNRMSPLNSVLSRPDFSFQKEVS
jgi:hypothetical protein